MVFFVVVVVVVAVLGVAAMVTFAVVGFLEAVCCCYLGRV